MRAEQNSSDERNELSRRPPAFPPPLSPPKAFGASGERARVRFRLKEFSRFEPLNLRLKTHLQPCLAARRLDGRMVLPAHEPQYDVSERMLALTPASPPRRGRIGVRRNENQTLRYYVRLQCFG